MKADWRLFQGQAGRTDQASMESILIFRTDRAQFGCNAGKEKNAIHGPHTYICKSGRDPKFSLFGAPYVLMSFDRIVYEEQ